MGIECRGRPRRPARPRYVAFYALAPILCAAGDQFRALVLGLPALAGILAAFWGVLLGFPVLRLRGDYLAIVTLAFGEIIRLVIINWQSLTGGPNASAASRVRHFFAFR